APAAPSLFPYTTLFRSGGGIGPDPGHRGLLPGRLVQTPGVVGPIGPDSTDHPRSPAAARPGSSSPSPSCGSLALVVPQGLLDGRSEEHTSELQSLTNLV